MATSWSVTLWHTIHSLVCACVCVCECVVVTLCFSSGELIRPLQPAERCVTMKVTSSIPACNVTPVTLRQTASLLSRLVPVFGAADAVAETLLCSLSLNYSMKSYLVQVNVLLQNIWRAIGHTRREDGEEIKECGKSRDLFKNFFTFTFLWFPSRDFIQGPY